MGNKVVLKGFDSTPIIEEIDGSLVVKPGDPCGKAAPPGNETETEESMAAMATTFGLSFLFGRHGYIGALGTTLLLTSFMGSSTVSAQDAVECQLLPIEVEIYVDSLPVNEQVMKDFQSGDFEVCPPESTYWKHHPDVYGGYEGCVGEKALYPCAQDSQGVWEEDGALAAKYPINFDGTACVETGYTTENRTFWILWGDPLDKFELNKRTGLNPVVSFPFNRGPYPRYEQGVSLDMAYDDSSDARAAAKDLLVYIGAFSKPELEGWDITMTEGAESGMVAIWAGKALEIAQTTCNRDIYALMEAPAYGYSPGDSADIVNKFSSTFYNGTECICYVDDSCLEPTVTISNRGWLPGTPLPVELGGDNNTYAADSSLPSSPWFESMVFPENPSGKIKTSQLNNPGRLVCDGVYVWPMYFGMTGYEIPMDRRPDCSAWSFSITKAYSASVRAGFIMYRENPTTNHDAMVDAVSDLYSMTHGLYSEWSWFGQMQLWDMIMSKPVDDPTSWIGAYSEIMDEKWSLIIDAFAGCPVAQVSNPKAGAYVWFVFQAPYLGIQDGFIASWFREVLGVRTTTYNWGFRGADPADFYGPDYTVTDFARLQLYRDVSIYEEVARRAKIVCADPDAMIGDFLSTNQWVAMKDASTRRRLVGYSSRDERKRHLQELVPNLTSRQLEYVAKSHEDGDEMDEKAKSCAPDFTTSCLFKAVGNRFADF